MQLRKNNPQISGRGKEQKGMEYGDVGNTCEMTFSQRRIWRVVFLDMTPCSQVEVYRLYRGTCSLHHRVALKWYSPNLSKYEMGGGCKTNCQWHCKEFVSLPLGAPLATVLKFLFTDGTHCRNADFTNVVYFILLQHSQCSYYAFKPQHKHSPPPQKIQLFLHCGGFLIARFSRNIWCCPPNPCS